jgi:hypothetical protein
MSLAGPAAPRRIPLLPDLVQDQHVLIGIEAGPESVAAIGDELAISRQALEWALLQWTIVKTVENLGFEHEEASIDPVLQARLLDEGLDPSGPIELENPELGSRSYSGKSGEPGVFVMERDQACDVEIGQTVPVRT